LTVEGGNFGYPGANVSCSWSGPDGAFVTVAGLTGAQWAFDAIAASPDKIIMRWLAPGSLIDVSGTDGTIVSFVDSVYVLFVRDGTLTSLTFDDLERDPPTVTARIQAFVDAMP
jgi:hypothetical protein